MLPHSRSRAGRIERGLRSSPEIGVEELNDSRHFSSFSASAAPRPNNLDSIVTAARSAMRQGSKRISRSELDQAISSYDMAITRLIKLSESL